MHMNRSGMRHWRTGIVAACILLGGGTLAVGQVRVGVGVAVPGLSIGINIPAYPELVPIPGYPVYYAPALGVNLFFYDGLYWVFVGDDWYYSAWYGGPWYLAEPELVPDFILRIPILYYRRPPPYFLHWNRAAPPRWGEHWGHAWAERRRGWDRWNRGLVPPRAPLPGYQSRYPRGRYPDPERQRALEHRYYNYTPRDPRDRSRLERAPQLQRPVAPQPNRSAPQRRRPEPQPDVRRAPPGAAQRPPAAARPSAPAGAERRAPDAGRPGARPGGQRSQPHTASPAPQGRPREAQDGGDERRGHRPPG